MDHVVLSISLRKKYGAVFSMKAGSFKLVVAADGDSAKEVLVKRSADYAGRPPFYTFLLLTTGTNTQVYFTFRFSPMLFHRSSPRSTTQFSNEYVLSFGKHLVYRMTVNS